MPRGSASGPSSRCPRGRDGFSKASAVTTTASWSRCRGPTTVATMNLRIDACQTAAGAAADDDDRWLQRLLDKDE